MVRGLGVTCGFNVCVDQSRESMGNGVPSRKIGMIFRLGLTIPDLDRVCTELRQPLGGGGSMAGSLKGTRGDKDQGVEEETDKSGGVGARGSEDGDDTADCGEFIGASCGELGSTGKDGEEVDPEVERADSWELSAVMD
jgi:hypothetical protein